MKVLLFVSVLAIAGCASAPEVQESKPARTAGASRTADIQPQASRRPRAVNPASQEKVSPELRASWEEKYKEHPLGNFTIVMKNGTEYFCRREAPTGSNLKRRGQCLTREELEAAGLEAQRQVRELQRPTPVEPTNPMAPTY